MSPFTQYRKMSGEAVVSRFIKGPLKLKERKIGKLENSRIQEPKHKNYKNIKPIKL